MTESLVEKLKKEIGTADWALLKPHAERGSLLKIHPQLDLCNVAVHIARDQKEQVQAWLDEGKISRPSNKEMGTWETGEIIFTCVIVQPFVLIQLPS